MSQLHKKIAAETKQTLDFLQLRALKIFEKELELHYKEPVLIESKADYYYWPTGDPSKKTIVFECFINSGPGKPMKKFRSETTFELEGNLWVPRRLTLGPEGEAIEHFICEVDFVRKNQHELPIGYTWRIEGPMKKRKDWRSNS